jgi:ATP-dependent helicase/nuclease subunit A
VTKKYMMMSIELIEKAINNILADATGRWIMHNHQDAKSEFPLTLCLDNCITHLIMDRTFIDEEGYRWIIDYKSSDLMENGNRQLHLEKAKMRYTSQLENYARAMRLLENRAIKLGLYFPLFSGWCEWEYNEN